ncbi:hypothetical protein [Marinobacter fuscus]|uniref:hypothetical protein n=1 Tax=Marinobacter fuscus TaxID=2109942 RepID=UPI00105711F4|nr:hypothetical protein [Marinobacter fuscus]
MSYLILIGLLCFPISWFRLGLAIKRLIKGQIEACSGAKSLLALLWLLLMITAIPLNILFLFSLPFGVVVVLLAQLIWFTLFEICLYYGFQKTAKLRKT